MAARSNEADAMDIQDGLNSGMQTPSKRLSSTYTDVVSPQRTIERRFEHMNLSIGSQAVVAILSTLISKRTGAGGASSRVI